MTSQHNRPGDISAAIIDTAVQAAREAGGSVLALLGEGYEVRIDRQARAGRPGYRVRVFGDARGWQRCGEGWAATSLEAAALVAYARTIEMRVAARLSEPKGETK